MINGARRIPGCYTYPDQSKLHVLDLSLSILQKHNSNPAQVGERIKSFTYRAAAIWVFLALATTDRRRIGYTNTLRALIFRVSSTHAALQIANTHARCTTREIVVVGTAVTWSAYTY